MCAEEVRKNVNTVKPVPDTGEDHILVEVSGSRHTERGEDEHAQPREREKCDPRLTVAAPGPTMRRNACNQIAHQKVCRHRGQISAAQH